MTSPAKRASPIATEQNIAKNSSHEHQVRQVQSLASCDWLLALDTLLVVDKRTVTYRTMIGSQVPKNLDFTIVSLFNVYSFTELHSTVSCGSFVVEKFKIYRQVYSPKRFKTKRRRGSFSKGISVVMDCEATRIIQVSLSKITDSRRCRGGPLLRRNLLVSHVLNNVLTSTDSAYCTYRSKVEVDMDIDAMENELVPFDKSKATPGIRGGSVDTGNTTHTVRSAAKSNERVTEIGQSVLGNARKESMEVLDIDRSKKVRFQHGKEKKSGDKCVTGSKRARSYVNEPCDGHEVQNKRFKTETDIESSITEFNHQEPMDISGLVNVFSSSFSGLCNLSSTTSSLGPSRMDSFQRITPVQPVRGVFGWPQTVVEAF